jgi:hypothetical protein
MTFDYEKFESKVQEVCDSYNAQTPYPFAYFDGLFDEALLDEINREIDLANFEKDVRSIDGVEVKTRSDFEDNESLPPATRRVFELINGGKFLNIVSKLTGIGGLISDPYYDGGGINVIENNGTLAVHVDGTTQHRMQVCRRINAILFLNDDWDPNWNGYHEQWDFVNKELSPFDDEQEWKCVRKILPKKNRLFFFTTNDHSWHGHAGVLNVPEGVQRRSLIAYYYTSSRPDSDLVFENPHRALFINNEKTLRDGAFDEVEVVL